MDDAITEALTEIERREREKQILEDSRVRVVVFDILQTAKGRDFFIYLFKHLQVGELPEKGLESADLHETIGFLRAGQAIFNLAVAADPQTTARMLSTVRKEQLHVEKMVDLAERGKNGQ